MAPRANREQILQMYAEGISERKIANDLGISRTTVHRHVNHQPAHNELNRAPGPVNLDITSLPSGGKRAPKATGGRLTSPKVYGDMQVGTMKGILPPPDEEHAWRSLEFSKEVLQTISSHALVDLLMSASPDISRAVWDTVQMVNPDHTITCWNINSGRTKKNKRAQKAADEFTQRIIDRHGSESALYSQFTIGAFGGGAWFSELILNREKNKPIDLVAPDPLVVRFRLQHDPDYGDWYEKGYFKRGENKTQEWVSLDVPTVVYIPVQPKPGSPYGRPPVAPAIFPALFLLSVLHDLKRVVAQQGFTRVWVKILSEKVKELMALDNLDDIDDAMADLAKDFNAAWRQQNPEDSWVSPDYFDYTPIEGAISASSSTVGSADSLIGALERMLVRALKSMPIVMGAAEGVSEANANRQWEVYMASIDSFQDDLGEMIRKHYTTALNVQGIQADVEVVFKQVRASEEYRDAQTKLIAQEIAERSEAAGYIDRDEAAMSIWNHKATGTKTEEIETDPDNDVPNGAGQTDGEPDSREKNVIVDRFGVPIRKRGRLTMGKQ